MASKKNPVSKPATAQRMSPDTQTARGQAALARLGNYLSARGSGGSADRMAARSDARVRALRNAVATARGGGQGRVAPTSRIVSSPKKDKTTPKMNQTQRGSSFRKNAPQGAKPKKK